MVVILGYTTFNLLKKYEKEEDIILSQDTFIQYIQQELDKTQKRLDEIDQKETFKSDDEIGWFFEEIKKLQNNLSRFRIN